MPKYKMEVFFDYECPHCMRGHEYLLTLLPEHPEIEVIWRPTEAHPRPETHGLHSDLCLQGMFFAQAQGADLMRYHERMYKAALADHANIESVDALVPYVEGLLDPDAFRSVLEQGKYAESLRRANDYAYEQKGVWAMPAYRMGGKKLDSIEGVGVTKDQLVKFLNTGK